MKTKNTITIIPSVALSEMKLDDLIGRKAVIVERRKKGCWVMLCQPYMCESEWFIPNNSIIE